MIFLADGVTLNFLRVGELAYFSIILSLGQSDKPMSHPALLSCGEKIVAGFASNKEDQCKHRYDFDSVRLLTF